MAASLIKVSGINSFPADRYFRRKIVRLKVLFLVGKMEICVIVCLFVCELNLFLPKIRSFKFGNYPQVKI